MSNNQFIAWATGVGANTMLAADYIGSGLANQGAQAGQASSKVYNTSLRQSTSIAAMIAQFMADNQSGDVLDNGNLKALEAQFLAAVQTVTGYNRYATGTDVGTADALSATTTPLIQTLVPGQLILLTRQGTAANKTTSPTLAINGLSPTPILKASGAAPGAGDLPGSTALLFEVDANLNFRLVTVGYAFSDLVAAAQQQVSLNVLADGCCSLSVVDVNHIVMKPKNGNTLFFNGAMQVIPAAGFTASTVINETQLPATPNTLYYAYAQMVSGNGTLQLSRTGYTTDGSGRNNKSNDATQRLVGMVYTNSSGQFQDTLTFRGVLNYFNRKAKPVDTGLLGVNVPNSSSSSNGIVPVPATPVLTFLTWGDEYFNVRVAMVAAMFAPGYTGYSQQNPGVGFAYIDGAQAGTPALPGVPVNDGVITPMWAEYAGFLSEGVHTGQGWIASNAANAASSQFGTQFVTVTRG